MRLWSIQPEGIYYDLKDKKILLTDIRKSDTFMSPQEMESGIYNYEDIAIKNAYNWLVREMHKRIPDSLYNPSYPWWAWHTYNGKHKKPDLRHSLSTPGEKCACIELEIPDKDVLLHDYDNWHIPLGGYPLILDAVNEEDWERKYERFNSIKDSAAYTEAMEKSWEGIFNVDYCDIPWQERGMYIQATFWELRYDQVVNVRFFTSR